MITSIVFNLSSQNFLILGHAPNICHTPAFEDLYLQQVPLAIVYVWLRRCGVQHQQNIALINLIINQHSIYTHTHPDFSIAHSMKKSLVSVQSTTAITILCVLCMWWCVLGECFHHQEMIRFFSYWQLLVRTSGVSRDMGRAYLLIFMPYLHFLVVSLLLLSRAKNTLNMVCVFPHPGRIRVQDCTVSHSIWK